MDRKEYDKALADCNEAIRLSPRLSMAYDNRANAWAAKNELGKALADLDEAIRLDPRNAWAYANRAAVWVSKNEPDKALADFDEALRINPRYAWAYAGRGEIWFTKREYGKALADDDEAIRFDPREAGAENGRAWIRATCPEAKYRDGERAVASATRACELTGWKDAYHLGTLAAAYAEAGDFDAAVKWQTKANALYAEPDDKTRGTERLKLYQARTPYRQTRP